MASKAIGDIEDRAQTFELGPMRADLYRRADVLRARLASPDPERLRAMVDALDDAACAAGWDARDAVPDDGGPPYSADEDKARSRNAARTALLAALGLPDANRGRR